MPEVISWNMQIIQKYFNIWIGLQVIDKECCYYFKQHSLSLYNAIVRNRKKREYDTLSG